MKQIYTLVVLAFIINLGYSQIPYNYRYTESVFDNITVTSNVIYGNASALQFPYLNENQTVSQDLLLDIYLPETDTVEYRPALVCAHSGAFISGTKSAEDMVAFCDSMAHRGYVTVSIEYRLGMNVFSAESSTRAVYRGFQDGRSAIRFLKENAELYGVDTNNIYMLGSSAGAYVGLHNLYMDTEDERPPETYINPDLGCLDCSGNNFEHSGRANGLISLWGALQDTLLIVKDDVIPIFVAHGTADATVPFGYGSAFGNPAFPATYGSDLIANRIEDLGNDVEKYFVFGEGHEFYGTNNGDWPGSPNNYWDTVFNKTESFAYNIHKPVSGFDYVQMENSVMFNDLSSGGSSWYWDFGDGGQSNERNPSHVFDISGVFTVTQFVSNNLASWDTAITFIYSSVGTLESSELQISIYPNPATSFVTIKNSGNRNLDISIIDSYGRICDELVIQNNEYTVYDLTKYSKGIYTIVASAKRKRMVKKILVY